MFDVDSFYPSIKYKLLKDAIERARQLNDISPEEKPLP